MWLTTTCIPNAVIMESMDLARRGLLKRRITKQNKEDQQMHYKAVLGNGCDKQEITDLPDPPYTKQAMNYQPLH